MKDAFMIDVNGFKITVRQSLITFKQILSGPGAFPKAILVIMCSTFSCVTSLMLNYRLGELNLVTIELFIIVSTFSTVFCPTEQKNLLKISNNRSIFHKRFDARCFLWKA